MSSDEDYHMNLLCKEGLDENKMVHVYIYPKENIS